MQKNTKNNSPALFNSKWCFDKNGYEIVVKEPQESLQTKSRTGRQSLLDTIELPEYKIIKRKSDIISEYYPTEVAGLARRFSDLYNPEGIKEEEVLAFVNEYGFLGFRSASITPQDQEFELLDDWLKAIDHISTIIAYIDRGQRRSLAYDLFNSLNIKMTARINYEVGRKPKLEITPTSLYETICFQIHEELIGNLNFERCQAPNCKNWFIARSNKKCCSTKCRKRLNRANKEDT